MSKRIDPVRDLRDLLNTVEYPVRYVGGEYQSVVKPGAGFRVALCFPDLYEIGMSNHAMAIIYSGLNAIEGVACERVFTPADDFAQGLVSRGLPLYGLESGTPLRDFDLIAFTIGYELSLTNLLRTLQLGEVSLTCSDRCGPVVIGGGPATTNPIPLGLFLDAVYIGEAEARFFQLVTRLRDRKSQGASRDELLADIRTVPEVWYAGKAGPTARAVHGEFATHPFSRSGFPVPNMRIVQDHGTVEIMRGCPNGCRFCHAGVFYRPFRMKDWTTIIAEIDDCVFVTGKREITLASLSTGDYPDIDKLVALCNKRYDGMGISFALPSLRVESFPIDTIRELAAVRRSGLTFAVETPLPEGQRALNKPSGLQRIGRLLESSSILGWRSAKFYFMLGLPGYGERNDVADVVEFLLRLRKTAPVNYTVAVGTFVPKPHTPFQWCEQMSETEALESLSELKRLLPRKHFRVSYHAPIQSRIEGLIARGNEDTGRLVLEAFHRGARFDAWDDLLNLEAWREAISASDVQRPDLETTTERAPLPWSNIKIVDEEWLWKEYEKSRRGELTGPCADGCSHNCGVCSGSLRPRIPSAPVPDRISRLAESVPGQVRAVLFRFEKQDAASFIPHLALIQVFERAFVRAGLFADFTKGFNPKPRLEFAHPLSIGVDSSDDYAMVYLHGTGAEPNFVDALNPALPSGLAVTGAWRLPEAPRPPALMSVFAGADYALEGPPVDDGLLNAIELGIKPGAGFQLEVTQGPPASLRLVGSQGSAPGLIRFLEKATGRRLLAEGLRIRRTQSLAWVKGLILPFTQAFTIDN